MQAATISPAGRACKRLRPGGIPDRDLQPRKPAYITGIEKSAPERMPVGQRDVTVFSRV